MKVIAAVFGIAVLLVIVWALLWIFGKKTKT
jgi:hypothetical protein